ncbi:Trk system potassium transporter TrkA [Stenotrophomonas sp. SRS1]|uniref:Trk system potassium transporter TrkA n=1 Tax=Stenotrophomonas sp. SRS1 TaxID=2870345 RepID=UPI002237E73A|nr:Trk system potassium transporter TrkA [Stenotrophomonas sp. SRS1]MCW6026727.1 Trk system potassium transporter TrkA [Stenotrophomonas sp. SRS1]
MKIIVCGAGQVGMTIARQLASEGVAITIIDTDAELIRRADESHDIRGVVGHASYPDTLREAGAMDADMLIAVTRSDEVNMVACQVAYSLFKVKRRIARLRHVGYTARDANGLFAAEHLPIDVIISPEAEVAEGITRRLRTPGAFTILPLARGQLEVIGLGVADPDCPAMGERICDLESNGKFEHIRVLAITRKGITFIPTQQDRAELADELYILARSERRKATMALFGHRERPVAELVIAGAGNVGMHLVRNIRALLPRARMTVIERDRDRARYAAETLGGDVVVLHGDALDRSVLEEARVDQKETLVAVTNDDESNIFCSLLARKLGCRQAVTLVNKSTYATLLPGMGINAVVSPSAVTVSTVLRHVRRGAIVGLQTLREDFGEVIEATIGAGSSPLLTHTIGTLGLPEGIKVGAVIREDHPLDMTAETRINAGDRVVLVVAYGEIDVAEKLLGGAGGRSF